MTTRDDLALEVATTVGMLNAKVQETITLGRPVDTVDYAGALNSACGAYDYLEHDEQD